MIALKLSLSILLVVLVLVYISLYFIFRKKFADIHADLRIKRDGIFCYLCSEVIISDVRLFRNIISTSMLGGDNLTLCKSCQRNTQLNKLLNFFFIKDKFRKFVLSKQSEIIGISIVLPSILLCIISFFITHKPMTDIVSIFNSLSLIFYWILVFYRLYILWD